MRHSDAVIASSRTSRGMERKSVVRLVGGGMMGGGESGGGERAAAEVDERSEKSDDAFRAFFDVSGDALRSETRAMTYRAATNPRESRFRFSSRRPRSGGTGESRRRRRRRVRRRRSRRRRSSRSDAPRGFHAFLSKVSFSRCALAVVRKAFEGAARSSRGRRGVRQCREVA